MSGARTAAILSAVLCIAACGSGDSGGVLNPYSSRTDAVASLNLVWSVTRRSRW